MRVMNERLVGILVDSLPKIILPGLTVTIPLTLISFALALVIAVVTALIRFAHVPVLEQIVRFYVWFIRGTPVLVQLFVVFYGLPSVGILIDPFPAAVLCFSINEGAYCSESIRAALESVPSGQMEAGYCVGMTYLQTMRRIVLPQAMRTAFPPLFNSLIALVKDTSLRFRQGSQLIQVQGEGGEAMGQKPVQLGAVHGLQGVPGLLGGVVEFRISGLLLLQTFDMGGELVRGLDEGQDLLVILQNQMGIAVPQLRGEHIQQPVAGDLLHLLVGVLDIGVIVFDGGGQIAGQDLGGVMVQCRHGAPVRIRGGQLQNVPPDQSQGVGQDGHLMAVFGDVFGKGVAHQSPAGDVAHPPHEGVKFIGH